MYDWHKISPLNFLFIWNLGDKFGQWLHWSSVDIGEVFNFRLAQNSYKSFELVNVIFSMEDNGFSQKLSKNTSYWPDIDRFCIDCGSDENLGRSVRSWSNIISDISSVSFLSGQIHISELELTLFIHQNILWF